MFLIRFVLGVALTAIFLLIGFGIFFWLVALILIVSLLAVPQAMRHRGQAKGRRGQFSFEVKIGGAPQRGDTEKVVKNEADPAPPRLSKLAEREEESGRHHQDR